MQFKTLVGLKINKTTLPKMVNGRKKKQKKTNERKKKKKKKAMKRKFSKTQIWVNPSSKGSSTLEKVPPST